MSDIVDPPVPKQFRPKSAWKTGEPLYLCLCNGGPYTGYEDEAFKGHSRLLGPGHSTLKEYKPK